MAYEYQFLQELIEKNTNGAQKLTISEVIKKMKINDVVFVGGKVVSSMPSFDNYAAAIVLDDGVGRTNVSVLPEIYDEISSRFTIGNIVICKGRIKEHLFDKKNSIENLGGIYRYILCSAVRVVKERENEKVD